MKAKQLGLFAATYRSPRADLRNDIMSKIYEYDFPNAISETDYCAFPSALEDDELVLFHATAVHNLGEIGKDGFKIPDPTSQTGLASVSFAKKSPTALVHVMAPRDADGLHYCILAVQYEDLNRPGISITSRTDTITPDANS